MHKVNQCGDRSAAFPFTTFIEGTHRLTPCTEPLGKEYKEGCRHFTVKEKLKSPAAGAG
jgi:hypothetical protein